MSELDPDRLRDAFADSTHEVESRLRSVLSWADIVSGKKTGTLNQRQFNEACSEMLCVVTRTHRAMFDHAMRQPSSSDGSQVSSGLTRFMKMPSVDQLLGAVDKIEKFAANNGLQMPPDYLQLVAYAITETEQPSLLLPLWKQLLGKYADILVENEHSPGTQCRMIDYPASPQRWLPIPTSRFAIRTGDGDVGEFIAVALPLIRNRHDIDETMLSVCKGLAFAMKPGCLPTPPTNTDWRWLKTRVQRVKAAFDMVAARHPDYTHGKGITAMEQLREARWKLDFILEKGMVLYREYCDTAWVQQGLAYNPPQEGYAKVTLSDADRAEVRQSIQIVDSMLREAEKHLPAVAKQPLGRA